MADRATELLALLRRNDPSQTSVNINLSSFSDDDELSQALQANDHVNEIHLYWYNLGWENIISNWDSLLRVIATRQTLETVDLYGHRIRSDRVVPFLLAFQQNPSIQTVQFSRLRLSGDLFAEFLDTATSVTTLQLWSCDMVAPGGALAVATALQHNKNIRRLELNYGRDRCLTLFVRGLASNMTMLELVLVGSYSSGLSLDLSLTVASLLKSNMAIQQLELKLDYVVKVDTFLPIVQGLIQNKSVKVVKFQGCRFGGFSEVLMLNSIFESRSDLQSLALVNCLVSKNGRKSFRTAIINLLQHHSSLRNLELKSNFRWSPLSAYGFRKSRDLNRLLTAVETSRLERFSIGKIVARESCQALITSIPRMQVRTLEFIIHNTLQDLKGCILEAIRRNASLRTVVVKVEDNGRKSDPTPCLANYDMEKLMPLISYSARNDFLGHQWIENPNAVPRAAWPEYLDVAQTTGPDTVFRILQALTTAPRSWFEGG
jgi:Ran GTPase-activating protein (RanGAP) involved in mRNA processing and transport